MTALSSPTSLGYDVPASRQVGFARGVSFLVSSAKQACVLGLLFVGLARGAEGVAHFGFLGPEIFPIDPQVGGLQAADIDGDGLKDLVVANNARSRIVILYNQTGRTNVAALPQSRSAGEINQLPPDARFRLDFLASEKRIAALVVADLNSDGRPDLAYYGEPKELIVQLNLGTNGWAAPKRWAISDGQLSSYALTAGDLDGDHLEDLLLLAAEGHIYWFRQVKGQGLTMPQKIPFTGVVRQVELADVNGDGRQDLLLVNGEAPNPVRVRLQVEAGQLGPEQHFLLPPLRFLAADDMDADGRSELITILQNSGRVQVSSLAQGGSVPGSNSVPSPSISILPLTHTGKERRGLTWADLDQDGLADLVVAEPESAQLSLLLQRRDGTFATSRTFPSLAGVTDIASADWDGDGRVELFLLSREERQVAVTRFEKNERVPFPRALALEGRPLIMTAGRLSASQSPALAVVTDHDGRRDLQILTGDGKVDRRTLRENFKSAPVAMLFHDVDQNGLMDIVILVEYERLKVLFQIEAGTFMEQDLPPPGGNSDQATLARADLDGDGREELLVAQKNFVRGVSISTDLAKVLLDGKTNLSFTVKDQVNGVSSSSRIVAATALAPLPGRPGALCLLDAEKKSVTFCERDAAGVWASTQEVTLPVGDLNGLERLDFAEPQTRGLALQGLNLVGWIRFGAPGLEFAEKAGYETVVRDGFLSRVVAGDLDGDGRKELIFLETQKNHLDVVRLSGAAKLVSDLHWPVFEERSFRNRRGEAAEPREVIVADLTGDGRNDLAIVVHDRILLYPQE